MSLDHQLDKAKRVVEGLGSMYAAMASGLGDHVRCATCGTERSVDVAKCLRSDWPNCCGHTMELQDKEAKP